MHAVVTGAGGFVGKVLAKRLKGAGWQVTTFGRFAAGEGADHVALGPAPWSVDQLASHLMALQPRALFHLAGTASALDIAGYMTVNVALAEAFLAAAGRMDVPPVVVLVGSAAEYGRLEDADLPAREDATCNPLGPYGRTKLLQTEIGLEAHRRGLPVVIPRLFNVVGPGMPQSLALGDFALQVANLSEAGGSLRTGNIDVERDYIDVEDAADIMMRLAETPASFGRIVNVCSGEAKPLRQLLMDLIRTSGKEVTVTIDPARLRRNDLLTFFGSTKRLMDLGISPPSPPTAETMSRLYRWAQTLSAPSLCDIMTR
jgi:nucleoside-diphosphate-sugar epimerase